MSKIDHQMNFMNEKKLNCEIGTVLDSDGVSRNVNWIDEIE
jgi:hypothetical protein